MLRKLALNAARFSGMGTLAGRFAGTSGAILMLHRVTPDKGKPFGFNRHLAITPQFLDDVLTEMRGLGFTFMSMDELAERLASGRCVGRCATVTADDGYLDNMQHALPVLEKHRAPITIYVAPGLVDGEVDLWWDVLEDIVTKAAKVLLPTPDGPMTIPCGTAAEKSRANSLLQNYLTSEISEQEQKAVLRDLADAAGVDFTQPSRETLMGWDDLRRISGHPLVTIGGHTVHHYNLMRLPPEKALAEMEEGANTLKVRLGARPRHFAYPYGYASAVGPREVALAGQAGFVTAVTTRHGVLKPGHGQHMQALPRISINGRYQQLGHVRTMVNGLTTPLANGGRTLVTV